MCLSGLVWSREKSTASLGPRPAGARTLRRLTRPASIQRISSLSRRRPTTRNFHPFYFAREERCKGSAPCLDDALLRAPFTPSTSRERSTARLGPHPAGARTLRRLPRPGGTELRPVPPHCSRDLGHGPGAGSGHLPRLQPPACSLPVSGVGMGLFVCGFFNAVSRPQLSCCSSLCDVGPLSVNVHYPRCMIPGLYENIQYNLSLSFHSGRPPRLATGAKDLAVRGYLTASRTRNSFSLSVTAP